MFKIEGINFFKYITPEACTDRLEIPLGHCWNMMGEVFPDSVILKDNNGNTWPVKLWKVENQVCFVGAGWLKFVRDNHIEPRSFLVVLLDDDDDDDDGPNVFSFVLLDAVTQCETGGFLGPSHVLPSFQPPSSSFLPQDDATQEEDLISDQSLEESDDDVIVYDDDDDDEDEEEDDSYHTDGEESPTEPCQGNTSSATAQGNRRARGKGSRNYVYGDEIFRSGVIPRPKNPYFVFYMNKTRSNELRVPFTVVKDYKLYLPKNAMIQDPQGKEWETVLSQWRDRRLVYKGALGRFFRVNHVQVGEPCVCV